MSKCSCRRRRLAQLSAYKVKVCSCLHRCWTWRRGGRPYPQNVPAQRMEGRVQKSCIWRSYICIYASHTGGSNGRRARAQSSNEGADFTAGEGRHAPMSCGVSPVPSWQTLMPPLQARINEEIEGLQHMLSDSHCHVVSPVDPPDPPQATGVLRCGNN